MLKVGSFLVAYPYIYIYQLQGLKLIQLPVIVRVPTNVDNLPVWLYRDSNVCDS